MPREDLVRLVARVVEVLGERLCRVELSNGHRLLAYARGRDRDWMTAIGPGSRVQIEVSPFDFSKGRIVSEREN